MRLSAYYLLIAAILIMVIFTVGYAGMYLSRDTSLVYSAEKENNHPVHLLIPAEGTTLVLDDEDNGQMYAIHRNTEFTIILAETLAHGYSWNTTISPGLHLLNSQYVADPYAPRFDVNGTHIWVLKAEETGMQEFRAQFVQGQDPDDHVAGKFSVRLLITPE